MPHEAYHEIERDMPLDEDDSLIESITVRIEAERDDGAWYFRDATILSLTLLLVRVGEDRFGHRLVSRERVVLAADVPDHYRDTVRRYIRDRWFEGMDEEFERDWQQYEGSWTD